MSAHARAFPGPLHGQIDTGMALRDWFAGQVLGAVVAGGLPKGMSNENRRKLVAQTCYLIADAMMEERKP